MIQVCPPGLAFLREGFDAFRAKLATPCNCQGDSRHKMADGHPKVKYNLDVFGNFMRSSNPRTDGILAVRQHHRGRRNDLARNALLSAHKLRRKLASNLDSAVQRKPVNFSC